MKTVVTQPGGTPRYTYDAAANDSDKTFTVPAGKRWDLKLIHVWILTTVAVGNRILRVDVGDGTNAIWCSFTTPNVAASQLGIISLSDGLPRDSVSNLYQPGTGTGANATVVSSLPAFSLPAGYTIRVWDIAAIAAAADDMTVVLHYDEYEA